MKKTLMTRVMLKKLQCWGKPPDFQSKAFHLVLVWFAFLLPTGNNFHQYSQTLLFCCCYWRFVNPPVIVDNLLDEGKATLLLHQLAILVRAHLQLSVN